MGVVAPGDEGVAGADEGVGGKGGVDVPGDGLVVHPAAAAAGKEVDTVDGLAPLGVEGDDVVFVGGEVGDHGAVGVAAAGAVGLRVPAQELAAGAHEVV